MIVIRVLPAVLTVHARVGAVVWRRQPETAISSLMQWLTLIKARVADCCEKMKKTAPTTLETLYSKASETLHLHEHPDRCADGTGRARSVDLGFYVLFLAVVCQCVDYAVTAADRHSVHQVRRISRHGEVWGVVIWPDQCRIGTRACNGCDCTPVLHSLAPSGGRCYKPCGTSTCATVRPCCVLVNEISS